MSDHEQGRRTQPHERPAGGGAAGGGAGKSTLTSRLGPSPSAIARAVVAQMKAAESPAAVQAQGDLDGPDVHALAAQGTAGGGGTLPFLDQIQRAFGHHDVSGVRAHVGGAAADASAAMGARAYAAGDAVAFAEAPDLHLAAHEAAHVVQQRGGVRLADGVGRAGDDYERHADAVADAVVRGDNAQALLDGMAHRGAAGGAAVQRNLGDLPTATELRRTAVSQDRRTGQAIQDDLADGQSSDPVLNMSNVGDVAAARAEVDRVRDAEPQLAEAIRSRTSVNVPNSALDANRAAIASLEEYIHGGEGQSHSILTFQANYQRLLRDYDRLAVQIDTMRASRRGAPMRAQRGGAELGRVTVTAAGVDPTREMRPSPAQAALQGDADAHQRDMDDLAQQVARSWSEAGQARENVRQQAQMMASGLTPRQEPAAVAARRRLEEKVERLASLASTVTSIASQVIAAHIGSAFTSLGSSLASAAGVSTERPTRTVPAQSVPGSDRFAPPPRGRVEETGPSPAEQLSSDVSGEVGEVVDLAQLWGNAVARVAFAPELDAAEAEAIAAVGDQNRAQIAAQKAAIAEADRRLRQKIVDHLNATRRFETAKRAYRLAVRRSAQAQDPSGRSGAVLGEVTAESGAFLAQADATIQLGTQLSQEGSDVARVRSSLVRGTPVRWYRPRREPLPAAGSSRWTADHVIVDIVHAPGRATYSDSADSANATLEDALRRMRTMRTSVQGFHSEVASPLGLATGLER